MGGGGDRGRGGGYVLFQFLCNLQYYCKSAYNKINSHQQKKFINITKSQLYGRGGGGGGGNRRERETHTHIQNPNKM